MGVLVSSEVWVQHCLYWGEETIVFIFLSTFGTRRALAVRGSALVLFLSFDILYFAMDMSVYVSFILSCCFGFDLLIIVGWYEFGVGL